MVIETVFDRLNDYHLNIILSIDVNPGKFLDIKLNNTNDAHKFNAYRENRKIPSPWTSETPKRFKRNAIN